MRHKKADHRRPAQVPHHHSNMRNHPMACHRPVLIRSRRMVSIRRCMGSLRSTHTLPDKAHHLIPDSRPTPAIRRRCRIRRNILKALIRRSIVLRRAPIHRLRQPIHSKADRAETQYNRDRLVISPRQHPALISHLSRPVAIRNSQHIRNSRFNRCIQPLDRKTRSKRREISDPTTSRRRRTICRSS